MDIWNILIIFVVIAIILCGICAWDLWRFMRIIDQDEKVLRGKEW